MTRGRRADSAEASPTRRDDLPAATKNQDLAAAADEARAAVLLLDAAPPLLGAAALHVLRGWYALARSRGGAEAATSFEAFLDALPVVAGVPADRAAELARLAPIARRASCAATGTSVERQVIGEARSLREAVRDDAGERRESIWGLSRRQRTMATATGFALAIAIVCATFGTPRPWKGFYYRGKALEGHPTVRMESQAGAYWGDGSPMSGLGEDDFSARWITCLHLEKAQLARFVLASDDGSRLFVDGAALIDGWSPHPLEAKSASFILGPGDHLLRIEYFDETGSAELHFDMAFGSDELGPPPIALLRAPGAGGTCDR